MAIFSLLPVDSARLVISFIGYEPITGSLYFNQNQQIIVMLTPQNAGTEEVVHSAESLKRPGRSNPDECGKANHSKLNGACYFWRGRYNKSLAVETRTSRVGRLRVYMYGAEGQIRTD